MGRSGHHIHAFSISKERARRTYDGSDQTAPWNGQGIAIMKKEHFEKLVASIQEAGEIKAGRRAPSRMYEIKPPEIKSVRERLNVSQNEFALMIGVSVRTLQNWEQGRRKPEGPAKALLRICIKESQRCSRCSTCRIGAGRRTRGWNRNHWRALGMMDKRYEIIIYRNSEDNVYFRDHGKCTFFSTKTCRGHSSN